VTARHAVPGAPAPEAPADPADGAMRVVRASHCTLEPLLAAHAPEMFVVLSDSAIYAFENAPPPSAAWLAERYRRLETRRSGDGKQRWLNWVVRLPGGALAGYVQATVRAERSALVAYELASRHWGLGLGASAVSAMLDELRARHGVLEFVAVLKAANVRSERLLRRLGFAPQVPPRIDHDADELVMSRPAAAASATEAHDGNR
jgi:ribosomal-protein-alanine N-acetyltransferase